MALYCRLVCCKIFYTMRCFFSFGSHFIYQFDNLFHFLFSSSFLSVCVCVVAFFFYESHDFFQVYVSIVSKYYYFFICNYLYTDRRGFCVCYCCWLGLYRVKHTEHLLLWENRPENTAIQTSIMMMSINKCTGWCLCLKICVNRPHKKREEGCILTCESRRSNNLLLTMYLLRYKDVYVFSMNLMFE